MSNDASATRNLPDAAARHPREPVRAREARADGRDVEAERAAVAAEQLEVGAGAAAAVEQPQIGASAGRPCASHGATNRRNPRNQKWVRSAR